MKEILPSTVSFSDYTWTEDELLVGELAIEIEDSIDLTTGDSESEEDEAELGEEEEPPSPAVSNLKVIEATTLLLRYCNQDGSFGTPDENACFVKYHTKALLSFDRTENSVS